MSYRVKRVRPIVLVALIIAAAISIWAVVVANALVFVLASLADLTAAAFLYRELKPGAHPHSMSRDTHFDR